MSDLIEKADGRVYSCARRDNIAAMKLHAADEWEMLRDYARESKARDKREQERMAEMLEEELDRK